MDSLLLQSASEIAVPQHKVNAFIISTIDQISSTLGWSKHRADTVLHYAPVELPPPLLLFSEGEASNPLHFAIAVACLIATVSWLIRGRLHPLGFYSLCCIVGYLLFVSIIRWQPYITRLHLTWLVEVSSVVGIVGSELRRIRPLVEFMAVALCVSSLPFLVANLYRPLWPQTYLVDDPIRTRFAQRPNMRAPYEAVIDHIRDAQCRKIGLLPLDDDYHLDPWEYPYWYFLRDQLDEGVRIEEVFPEQPPVAYPLGPFHPSCTVVMKLGEPIPPFEYDGAKWTQDYRSGPLALYQKTGLAH